MCVLNRLMRKNYLQVGGFYRTVSDIDALVNEVGETILNVRDEWGYTIAHWAALDGNVDLIRYLSDGGVSLDLSCFGTQGQKPIHWACRKGNVAVIDAIINVCIFKFKCFFLL